MMHHHKQLLPLLLLALTAGTASAQQASADVHRSQNSRAYHADAASLSEAADADGTKRGECAYADSDGQKIKVRFQQPPGGNGDYFIVEGNSRLEPASAYQQCAEQARKSQQINAQHLHRQFADAASAFSQFDPFAAAGNFNPYAGAAGGDFNQQFDGAYAGGDDQFAGAGSSFAEPVVGHRQGGGHQANGWSAGGAGGGGQSYDHADQIAFNIQNQKRTMDSFNQQIQANMLRMQQQNMDFHNRLMQQFGR